MMHDLSPARRRRWVIAGCAVLAGHVAVFWAMIASLPRPIVSLDRPIEVEFIAPQTSNAGSGQPASAQALRLHAAVRPDAAAVSYAAAPVEASRAEVTPPESPQPGNPSAGGLKSVREALRFGRNCAGARQRGADAPAGCEAGTLSSAAPLGPKPVPEYAMAAARINAKAGYQAAPGSTDFWKRVNKVPTPNDVKDDLPQYGLYSDPHVQKVIGQCGLTASCTQDGTDSRSPNGPS